MVSENNIAVLSGRVVSPLTFSHDAYGEDFYSFKVASVRLSGEEDEIVVTASNRLLLGIELCEELPLYISGQFRSYNSFENGAGRLLLTLFAKDIKLKSDDENVNQIELNGYICKPPVFRHTPFGREICDVLVAVNRSYNKSDYIPVIAWGRTARFASTLQVGAAISITGRMQSRKYQKFTEAGISEERTAYEVSIVRLESREEA